MNLFGTFVLLSAVFTLQPPSGDDNDLQKALLLERVMQQTIAQAETSVACIIVSRSDGYQRLGYLPDKSSPGKLGDLDLELFDNAAATLTERLTLRRKLDLADPGHVPQAFGSGVVIDPQGFVLTNFHVVDGATKIFVRLPGGRSSYADIHAADSRSDLAVLRLLNRKLLPLPVIRLGDADKLQRGTFVLSIANPFAAGFRDGQPSASWGILSNIRRRALGGARDEEALSAKPLHQYGTLLQTDARLHLGSSGGALVNLQGDLVGLITSLAALQGGETPGGFAIPVNAGMRGIIEVLKRGEEVEYGFLGVSLDERSADGRPGATLSSVSSGSPAKLDAKLRDRDVVVAINDTPLIQSDDLLAVLGSQLAGNKVRMQVRRQGAKDVLTIDATLAKLHVPGKKIVSSLGRRPFFRGLRVDYTSLLVQAPPKQPTIPPGVLVGEVQPNSAAERLLLKSGDVVTHVNGIAVGTPAAFYQAVVNLPGPVELTLYNFANQEPPIRVMLK